MPSGTILLMYAGITFYNYAPSDSRIVAALRLRRFGEHSTRSSGTCGGTDIMSTFNSHSTCIHNYGNRYYDDMIPIDQRGCIAPRGRDRFQSYTILHIFLISCWTLFECKQKPGILKSYETNYRSIQTKNRTIYFDRFYIGYFTTRFH
jgi:hypothetical protein